MLEGLSHDLQRQQEGSAFKKLNRYLCLVAPRAAGGPFISLMTLELLKDKLKHFTNFNRLFEQRLIQIRQPPN